MLDSLARHFVGAHLPQYVYDMIDRKENKVNQYTHEFPLDEPVIYSRLPYVDAEEVHKSVIIEEEDGLDLPEYVPPPVEPELPVVVQVKQVEAPQENKQLNYEIRYQFQAPGFKITEKDGLKTFIDGPLQKHLVQCGNTAKLRFSAYGTHPHPMAHVERDMAEYAAKRIMTRRGVKAVLDVGGNAARQALVKDHFPKLHTHSCCPVLSVDDVFRQQARESKKLTNYCQHTMQQCDCGSFDGLLLTQSLYYITPQDLAKKMIETNSTCTIATLHEFEGVRGKMYEYKVDGSQVVEATWSRTGDTITMFVNGNQRPYVHKALDWLYQESVYVGNGNYLIWQKLQDFGQTAIYQFSITRQPSISQPIHLGSINQIINMHRSILTEVKEIQSTQSMDYALIKPKTKIIKSLLGLSVINYDGDEPVYLPIDSIRQLTRFMMFKERTPATYQILVNQAKQMVNSDKELQRQDSATKQDFILFAPEIAFNNNLAMEFNQLKNVFDKHQVHQKLNDALKGIVGESVKDRIISYVNNFIGSEVTTNELSQRNLVQSGAFSQKVGMLQNAMRSMSSQELYSCLPEMTDIITKTANECDITGYKYCIIDGLKPISCLTSNDMKELATDALLEKIETLKLIHKDKATSDATVTGITAGFSMAVIPARDRNNTLHTVQQKVLCTIPQPNMTELARFNLWVDIHFDQLFDNAELYDKTKIQPYSVDEWIKSFPGGKRTRLNRIREQEIQQGNFSVQQLIRNCQRTVFCKSEPLSKRGQKFTARPVQSVGDMANIILGPWMRKFTHVLKQKLWHKDWQITYSCGMTALEIGDWYNKHVVQKMVGGKRVIFEDDFSAYDSTQNTGLLAIEQKVYKRLGIKPCDTLNIGNLQHEGLNYNAAELVLAQQTTTVGTTKYGDLYGRTGMRKSGDPNTSCGNTLINGLAHMFCFHKEHSRINQLNIFDKENDPMAMDVDLLLLGDDNLGSIDEIFVEYVDERLPKEMLKLGLKTKAATKTNIFDAEYCSGRIYQIDEDKWIYGPKWGRMLNRQAISMKQFHTVQEKKDWAIANMYSLRYTSWFIPGVEQWALGHMAAFGATDKWINGKVTKTDLLQTASKLTKDSAASEKMFTFNQIFEADNDILYNMPANKYTQRQFIQIYGFNSDDLILELNRIFSFAKAQLNNGKGVVVWNPIFEAIVRVDNHAQLKDSVPDSDGLLERDHFVQNQFQTTNVAKLNNDFITTFTQMCITVIKENIVNQSDRRVYLTNATYLHPQINNTNAEYGVQSVGNRMIQF